MALHVNVHEFYQEWLNKADSYSTDSLADCFNKAFSLFTLYNKLYAEATFILAKRGDQISFSENGSFPDRKGATEFAPKYIGFTELEDELKSCSMCMTALDSLILSLKTHEFYIRLSMPYGNRQPDKDGELLEELTSEVVETKIKALLGLLYSVRCNMFHGSKDFNEVQRSLLIPVTILQRKIIEVLYYKLAI